MKKQNDTFILNRGWAKWLFLILILLPLACLREDEELTTLEAQKNTAPFKKQFKDLKTQQVNLSELKNHSEINHLLQTALQSYPLRVLRSSRSTASQPQRNNVASDPELCSVVKGLQLSSSGIEKNQIGAYVSYTIPVIPKAEDDPSVVQNLVIEQTPSRQAVYLLDYPLEGNNPQGMKILAYKNFRKREEISARVGDYIDICIDTYHPAQPCACPPHHHYGESCHCPVGPRPAGYHTTCTTFFIFPKYVKGQVFPPGKPSPPSPPHLPGSPPLGHPGGGIGGDPAKVPGSDQDDSEEEGKKTGDYRKEPEKEDWLRKNNYNWQMCLLTASGGCANEHDLVVTRKVDGSYNEPTIIGMTKDVSDSLTNIVRLIGVPNLSKWEQKWLADHKEERELIEQFLEGEVKKERLKREAERKLGVASLELLGSLTKAGKFIMDLLPCLINETVDRWDLEDLLNNYTPFFKYPKNSNYKKLYPKFTEYLKNQMPKLKNNTKIINAIKKYTDLTVEQIQQDLQWGKGPTIRIVQLDEYCKKCNHDTYGLFKSETPNTLYIDIDLVETLEETDPQSHLADAFSFLLGVTILHEYVHFGTYPNERDDEERGLLFEQDAYGHIVEYENAQIILYKNTRR